jgi:hypothetical protein
MALETGLAVLVCEDILFWPLPGWKYKFMLDMLMPQNRDGVMGKKILCFGRSVRLHY